MDLVTKTSAFKHNNFRVPGGKIHCEDDIVDYVLAVCHDLRFAVNEKSYEAAELYLNSNMGLDHVANQAPETIYAYKMARDMSILAIRNKLGFNPFEDAAATGGALGGGGGGAAPRGDYDANALDDKYYDAANAIEANLNFIASTAMGRGIANYPSLTVPGGNQNCIDDIKDVLNALIFNLKHGGNNKMFYATEFYVTTNAISHVSSQATETKYIFEQARDIAIQVLRNESVTTNALTDGTQSIDSSVTTDTASPRCADQASAVTTLMGIPIQLFTNTGAPQAYLDGITQTLPCLLYTSPSPRDS